jgi:hypothetical protein
VGFVMAPIQIVIDLLIAMSVISLGLAILFFVWDFVERRG